jgi:hypothetical protein
MEHNCENHAVLKPYPWVLGQLSSLGTVKIGVYIPKRRQKVYMST